MLGSDELFANQLCNYVNQRYISQLNPQPGIGRERNAFVTGDAARYYGKRAGGSVRIDSASVETTYRFDQEKFD